MTSYSKDKRSPSELLICGVKGLAAGVIAAAALLFIFTAVAYGTEDPDSLTAPLGYAALYLSALIAGGAASRISRETGAGAALAGGSAGVMLLFLVIVMTLIPAEAPASAVSPLSAVFMYATVPAAAALGGLVVRHKRRKPGMKVRRRRR